MGLFDLDEYKRKKQRADESTTAPREFPVAFAQVDFDGREQKLRFQPIAFDGGHVFIGCRPQDAHELNAGGGEDYQDEFDAPNAHEHLEARLLLRDFLFERGVSLDELEGG